MAIDDTQPNQPYVLTELREMLKSGEDINDQAYKRMNLALIAEIYERQRALEVKIDNHGHPPPDLTSIKADISQLQRRDLLGIAAAAVLAVTGAIAAKLIK